MAVIFDMDGVIADTQCIHSRIESEMLKSFGIDISPEDITRRFSGMSLRDQFTTLFSEIGRYSPYTEEIGNEKVSRFCECKNEFKGIEGTIACIEKLHEKGVLLAVASASRPETIELVLGTIRVRDRFHAIASSREVKKGKPAPDVFLLAAERLGAHPSSCIVVEDGISGMHAARAAGMRCIALQQTSGDYPADIVVNDLRKVPFYDFFIE